MTRPSRRSPIRLLSASRNSSLKASRSLNRIAGPSLGAGRSFEGTDHRATGERTPHIWAKPSRDPPLKPPHVGVNRGETMLAREEPCEVDAHAAESRLVDRSWRTRKRAAERRRRRRRHARLDQHGRRPPRGTGREPAGGGAKSFVESRNELLKAIGAKSRALAA